MLRLSKCKFAQSQIKLLGQIVGNNERKVDPQKVEAVLKIQPPTSKKEIQSFLGLLKYYRSYVSGLSRRALCLTELTKGRKANELSLNSEQLQAFEDLKHDLTVAPVLATQIFDGKTPFILQCDASAEACAACLTQKQSDGNEKPISYASVKLTDTQRKWSVIELEDYAVIFGLRRFETYLIRALIIIVTNHNPLKYIVECSPKSACLTRWALSLQKFLILHVRHKKGTDNSNADALSRLMTVPDKIDEPPEKNDAEALSQMCHGVSQGRSSQMPNWMGGEKSSTRTEKEGKNTVTQLKCKPQSGPQSDISWKWFKLNTGATRYPTIETRSNNRPKRRC